MLNAGGIYEALKSVFEFDCEIGFRRFVRSTHTTKWIIAADFVTTGVERVNDTFAFTVYPYDKDEFTEMFHESRSAIPHDIKDVKRLHHDAAKFLADPRRFHLCFVPNIDRHRLSSLPDARETIEAAGKWVADLQDGPSKPHYVRKFQALLQRSKSKRFNHELLHDIVLLSGLAAYIALLIAKHSRSELILWLFDRDRMTTAFDGIIFDMAYSNFYSLCELDRVGWNRITLSFGLDLEARNGQAAWFDDLIRAPDYIAGTIARWDFLNNLVSSDNPKFIQVIEAAISENPNIALFAMRFSLFGTTCSRIRVFRQQNTNRTAYLHNPATLVDYLADSILRRKRVVNPTYRVGILKATAINNLNLKLWWRN